MIEIDLAEITEPILACPNDPRESVRLDKHTKGVSFISMIVKPDTCGLEPKTIPHYQPYKNMAFIPSCDRMLP